MLFNKVRADIWYFDSHGILIPGSIFIYGILTPLLKTDPPCMLIEPPWYFDPLIYNQEIGRGIKIPRVGGSICHGQTGQNTMIRVQHMEWEGQNIMGRGLNIP